MVRYWYVTIDFDCLKKNVRHWIESDNFVLQQGTSNSPTPNRCLVIRGCWKLSFMYAMRVAFFKHKSPIYIQCLKSSNNCRQPFLRNYFPYLTYNPGVLIGMFIYLVPHGTFFTSSVCKVVCKENISTKIRKFNYVSMKHKITMKLFVKSHCCLLSNQRLPKSV